MIMLSLLAPLARAAQLGELPGEEISTSEEALAKSRDRVQAPPAPPARGSSWLAPPIDEQLSRDRVMIPLGKGALFLPSYSEGRREPEITVLNARNRPVARGEPGERILLDSGSYRIRFGSGTASQQIVVQAHVGEGHTTVLPPTWSGLIVEILAPDGEYLDGQYELIDQEKWINYGKGRGLTQERLQDIRSWVVPPGIYRISKIGEGVNSLRNYITVQLNPGQLKQVELIMDKTTRDIISGGVKSLNTRIRVGRNWTYGLRLGGNVFINRETDDADIRTEDVQFVGDLRGRAVFDNVRYLGTTELVLNEVVGKERGERYSVSFDEVELRSVWVRRLNDWLGPYVRGSLETHFFPKQVDIDSVFLVENGPDGPDTVETIVQGTFEAEPSLDPLKFAEGIGVNVDFLTRYYMEASAQAGLAARQLLVSRSYAATKAAKTYERARSNYEIGAETLLLAVLRLGDQAAVDLRTELFFPDGNPSRLRIDDFTTDCRVYLSRYVEIGYVFQLRESVESVKNRYPTRHSFSLRLSLNF